jgi:hypothetical protein
MEDQVLDDVVARRFLLGQLPPEEQGRIEELAFGDCDTFAFLESVEDDLIDEFIRGDLSVDEKQRFERHFLSLPGRRKNLKISRVLQLHFDAAGDQKFSLSNWFNAKPLWVRLSLTVTATAVLATIGVLIVVRVKEAMQPAPIQAGPDRPGAVPTPEFKVSPALEPTASPVHVENKPKIVTPDKQKKPVAYALLVPSALVRGDGVRQLKLPEASSMTLELALITPTDFATYEAVLENEAGTTLQPWSGLKSARLTSGKALQIEVPVARLKPQEFYRIVVSGVTSKGKTEVIAQYPFEVSK